VAGTLGTVLLLAGCELGAPPAGSLSNNTGSSGIDTGASPDNQGATSAISRLPVEQGLEFSGPLTGRMAKAVTSCGGTNGQYSVALTGEVGSAKVIVYLTLVQDHGPGSYPARNPGGGVNVAIHTPDFDYEGVEGTFVTNNDHRTGTIDVKLTNEQALKGSYGCAPT
jgi:hypothetical protein